MIPGFVMPIHTFYPMRAALKKAGYTDMTIMNQWPWFGRIEEYAAIARMHVDAAKKRTGAKKVELLGHSMGGLTARTLVKSLGGDKDVAHVVTYGTPHHGTVLGNLAGWALPSCHEMSLGSDFIKQLNDGDETPGDIKYTSIHCAWDEIVVPGRSVDLAGAENLNVKNTFHIEMMFDPTSAKLTLEALAK
jgi:triacylglycerol esterase/lipase EstA (alpha/beta hydrolase family)